MGLSGAIGIVVAALVFVFGIRFFYINEIKKHNGRAIGAPYFIYDVFMTLLFSLSAFGLTLIVCAMYAYTEPVDVIEDEYEVPVSTLSFLNGEVIYLDKDNEFHKTAFPIIKHVDAQEITCAAATIENKWVGKKRTLILYVPEDRLYLPEDMEKMTVQETITMLQEQRLTASAQTEEDTHED